MTRDAAVLGAVANGIGQYFGTPYSTFLSNMSNWPILGSAISAYQNLPDYIQRVGDGALVGASAVVVPYLIWEAGRAGLYGTVARGAGRALQAGGRAARAAGRTYININRRLYNPVNNWATARYGANRGRILAAGVTADANLMAASAVYTLGRIAGLL